MSRPCHILRVFTRGDGGGNHLGVVADTVGVTDVDMQGLATDLGFSETIFVEGAGAGVPPTVRIFTPREELPFAGHPLVGAAWMLSMLGRGASGHIRTAVGDVAYAADGDRVSVTCDIPVAVLDDDVVDAVAAAGLPQPDATIRLGLPREYLIARYRSDDDVGALAPDLDALADRFGLLAYARDGSHVKARFFAPGTAVPEDPATGSAAVALAHSFVLGGETDGSVVIHQGDEIGHPSTIELSWRPGSTTIGGAVRRDEVRQVL